MCKLLMALVCAAAPVAAQAATYILDESAFNAALSAGSASVPLHGIGFGNPINTSNPLATGNGTYSGTISSTGGLFSLVGALSTGNLPASIDISFAGSPNSVNAVGLHAGATDFFGNYVDVPVIVTLDDGTTQTLSTQGFVGFVSTSPIATCTVRVSDESGYSSAYYSTIHDVVFGEGTVPEPMALSLVAAGGAMFLRRRRQRA